MKNSALIMIIECLFILCACNKEKKNPVFGDYQTAGIQINFPANDTITLDDKIISVSYFAEGQIKADDFYLYRSSGDGNFYTGGDTYTNTNWTLQYFPRSDSIELRWNQYGTTSSVTKSWRGTKIN